MKTAARAPTSQLPDVRDIFGDPWETRGTARSRFKAGLLVGAILVGTALFAVAAAAWVSSISPESLDGDAASLAEARVAFANETTAGGSPEVPVLLPRNLTGEQFAEVTERFRATPDGYFVRISFDRYDVVLNGTSRASAAPGGGASRGVAEVRISESETGLSATFSRNGADYQVEFACRGPGDEAGADCLTEAEARAFVADLVETPAGGS